MTYAETYAALLALLDPGASACLRVETWRHTYGDSEPRVETIWTAHVFKTHEHLRFAVDAKSPERLLAAVRAELHTTGATELDSIGVINGSEAA